LQDRGCRVDVVGSQSHLELGDEIADQVATTIKECATLGIRCAFTELDVDVVSRKLYWNEKTRPEAIKQNPYVDGCPEQILEQQADAYRRLFEVVMENREHVDRVTLWGLDDGHSWLNNWPWKRVNHALLFDREARPKPAFHGGAGALAGS
jgi:endo-1,4-beta-xylanase